MRSFTTIPTNVTKITEACADAGTEHRFGATAGVKVTITPLGDYDVRATDGKVGAIITGVGTCDGSTVDEKLNGKAARGEPKTSGVIPAKEFAAFASEDCLTDDFTVSLGSQNCVLFSKQGSGEKCFTVVEVEGRFPELDQVIPKKAPKATAKFTAANMIRLLKIANEIECGDHATQIEIYDGLIMLRTDGDCQKLVAIMTQVNDGTPATPTTKAEPATVVAKPIASVLQDWVATLGLRHQGVLLTAVRGCDTAPKNDPSKNLVRCYRSVILNCHCGDAAKAKTFIETVTDEELQARFTAFRKNLDHYQHHYIAHLMHAAEIVGYKHPIDVVRGQWRRFYVELCRGLHVNPESEEQCDVRLNADEETFGKADQ